MRIRRSGDQPATLTLKRYNSFFVHVQKKIKNVGGDSLFNFNPRTVSKTLWKRVDSHGSTINGSDLEKTFGWNAVPDARGLFLRVKNNGRSDGQENPSGDLNL